MANNYSALVKESSGLSKTLLLLTETITNKAKDISQLYTSGDVPQIPYSEMPVSLAKGFVMSRIYTEVGVMDTFLVKAIMGSSLPLHHHELSLQSVIVISGVVEVCVQNEPYVLTSTGAIEINPGDKHSIRALTDSVFIKVFRPPLMQQPH